MSQGSIISAVISAQAVGAANNVIDNVACDSSVFVGAVVRMDASGTAYNALADSITNSNVLGICETKTSSTVCTVRVSGVSEAIYSSLDVTKEYYLSDSNAGHISITVPTTSGHVRIMIGQPYSSTEMFVSRGERSIRA